MSRLKDMEVIHHGQTHKRHIYIGDQTACVLISKHWYEAKWIAPGTYQTGPELSLVEWNIILEQAEVLV